MVYISPANMIRCSLKWASVPGPHTMEYFHQYVGDVAVPKVMRGTDHVSEYDFTDFIRSQWFRIQECL